MEIRNLATHEEKHVTVAELARYWRVSERTVQYQITKGALRATRIGRSLRIEIEDARKFGRMEEVITGPMY